MGSRSVIINIDIDTTGLNPRSDQICRIFAFNNEGGYVYGEEFSLYLMPTCPFNEEATRLNGFTIGENNGLLLCGEPVESVSQQEGFQCLYEYILTKGQGNCVLISHYAKGFLAPFLVNGFCKYLNLTAEKLDSIGLKFADSYLIIEPKKDRWLPGIKNLKEPTIFEYLFPDKKTYKTPNARNDAIALNEILTKLKISSRKIVEHTFSSNAL